MLVEQDLHVEDGVDGHSGLADVARDALVVGVVAAVGSQIKGDREAFLARGEVAAIERVGLFGGGEAGVLANSPGLHHVHGAVRAAQIWRDSCCVVEVLDTRQITGGVEGFDGDVLESEEFQGGVRGRRSGGSVEVNS